MANIKILKLGEDMEDKPVEIAAEISGEERESEKEVDEEVLKLKEEIKNKLSEHMKYGVSVSGPSNPSSNMRKIIVTSPPIYQNYIRSTLDRIVQSQGLKILK